MCLLLRNCGGQSTVRFLLLVVGGRCINCRETPELGNGLWEEGEVRVCFS